jgi:ribosome-associated heat shock protein Hsp15
MRTGKDNAAEEVHTLRLDKWLWFARMVKTRALAQEVANSGHVRLNGQRIKQSAKLDRIGDVLTISLPSRVRVVKIVGFSEQRGDAEAGAGLYEELTERALGHDLNTMKRKSPLF